MRPERGLAPRCGAFAAGPFGAGVALWAFARYAAASERRQCDNENSERNQRRDLIIGPPSLFDCRRRAADSGGFPVRELSTAFRVGSDTQRPKRRPRH
jgi:hypothetical protein